MVLRLCICMYACVRTILYDSTQTTWTGVCCGTRTLTPAVPGSRPPPLYTGCGAPPAQLSPLLLQLLEPQPHRFTLRRGQVLLSSLTFLSHYTYVWGKWRQVLLDHYILYICMCMYTHTYVCTCTNIYARVHVHTNTDTCAHRHSRYLSLGYTVLSVPAEFDSFLWTAPAGCTGQH